MNGDDIDHARGHAQKNRNKHNRRSLWMLLPRQSAKKNSGRKKRETRRAGLLPSILRPSH